MDFNFIQSSTLEADKELFFSPITEDDSFTVIDDTMTMANVMFIAGIFPSVTQARNNGYNKPIPKGFMDMRVSKRKIRITILKEIK